MKMHWQLLIGLLIFISETAFSQKPLNQPVDDGPKSQIELKSADNLIGTSTSTEQQRTFTGNVKFRHRGVDLYCNRAIHNVGTNDIKAYGNIKIVQGDTLTITGDTLFYEGNIRFAKIFGKIVTLTDEDTELVSTQVNYNLNTDVAYYPKPGVVTKDSSVLSSDKGFYNTRTKEFDYYGNVEIKNPNFILCTDSLEYDSKSGLAVFETYTTITSKDGILSAKEGTYNTKSKQSFFVGRSQVENEEYFLIADTLNFNNEKQEGFGIGNVLFHSKAENLYINGDFGEKLQEKAYTKMVGNTLTRKIEKTDTLFLRADSVIAFNSKEIAFPKVSQDSILSDSLDVIAAIPNSSTNIDSTNSIASPPEIIQEKHTQGVQNDSTSNIVIDSTSDNKKVEFIIANGNVKIYRKDFQSSCDSLNYDLVDSLITFFGKPIIWSDGNQLVADSIETILKNNRISRMYLSQNSFVISQDTVGNFNQVKGRQIEAIFDSTTAIRNVNVFGNGESIYFALDEQNKLLALNRVICSKMNLLFGQKKVQRIAFIGVPESKFIPPHEIDQSVLELDNFKWRVNEKPTKNQVIGTIFVEDLIDKSEGEIQPQLE